MGSKKDKPIREPIREPSQQTKSTGSFVAAVLVVLLFLEAIRSSCLKQIEEYYDAPEKEYAVFHDDASVPLIENNHDLLSLVQRQQKHQQLTRRRFLRSNEAGGDEEIGLALGNLAVSEDIAIGMELDEISLD